jgi:hypothetical protein
VDGTTQRMPDSDENRPYFGLANGGHRGLIRTALGLDWTSARRLHSQIKNSSALR